MTARGERGPGRAIGGSLPVPLRAGFVIGGPVEASLSCVVVDRSLRAPRCDDQSAQGTPDALSTNAEVRRVYLGEHFKLN